MLICGPASFRSFVRHSLGLSYTNRRDARDACRAPMAAETTAVRTDNNNVPTEAWREEREHERQREIKRSRVR